MDWLPPAVGAALIGAHSAPAAVFFDESSGGDLSGDRLAPTAPGALQVGSNTLRATSTAGDLEYVTFSIPPGLSVVSLNLADYDSVNDTAFLAIQAGTTFTVAPEDAPFNLGSLLGWTHFGSGGSAGTALEGTDILDELGSGAGAIGFSAPLTSGNYTLWIQQTTPAATTYTFDFAAVPEPGALGLTAGALLAAFVLIRVRRTLATGLPRVAKDSACRP